MDTDFQVVDRYLTNQLRQLFHPMGRDYSLAPPSERCGARIGGHMDMMSTDDDLYVNVELPGVSKRDIQIDFYDGMLRVTAEKKQESCGEGEKYIFNERTYGKIERIVKLPESVDGERGKACFEEGVLKLQFPKFEEDASTKRITID